MGSDADGVSGSISARKSSHTEDHLWMAFSEIVSPGDSAFRSDYRLHFPDPKLVQNRGGHATTLVETRRLVTHGRYDERYRSLTKFTSMRHLLCAPRMNRDAAESCFDSHKFLREPGPETL